MPSILTSVLVAVLLLAGCASARDSSEAEWARGQCGQVIDKDAQEKCLKRVEDEYWRKPSIPPKRESSRQ